jgi:CheY-like chemotaxis protein
MTTPLRIFIVDDDADVADSLAEVLELSGHQVTVAYGSSEAVDIFQREDFDLAFMDVMMPGMNGVESFIEIKKFKPDAKVVMMTGFSVQDLLDQAMEEGAAGVLHKPVAVEDVLSMLETCEPSSDRKALVLIADHEESFRRELEKIIQGRGYRVRSVQTGEEALEAVQKLDVDVLILDLDLPVIDGLEVYCEMKRKHCNVPTLVVASGPGKPEDTGLPLKDPAVSGILFKPVDPAVLLSSLEKLAVTNG